VTTIELLYQPHPLDGCNQCSRSSRTWVEQAGPAGIEKVKIRCVLSMAAKSQRPFRNRFTDLSWRNTRSLVSHRSEALYQGTALAVPHYPTKIWALSPWAFCGQWTKSRPPTRRGSPLTEEDRGMVRRPPGLLKNCPGS
jgi:hypothetical protein